VCMTINDSWGVNAADENHKSTRQLVHMLARAASAGANYLLNVGPTALGEILPVHVQRLREMGAWLRAHGEAIYGTRAGLIPPTADSIAVSTRRGETHYVHALNYVGDCVRLPGVPAGVTRATLVKDGAPVKMARAGDLLALTIPAEQRDPLNTVVRLD